MKKTNLKKIITMSMAVICAVSLIVNAYAATGRTNAGEYGELRAENTIARLEGYDKRVHLSVATTNKAADKYILKYNVVYAESGASITGTVELVNINMYTAMKSSETVEMRHWKNTVTGKVDGFLSTKIKAYSTHEVRGDYAAYVVYLSDEL